VSDVTCIPMESGFVYLTVIMNWYSRKVLNWRVSNSLDASFAMWTYLRKRFTPDNSTQTRDASSPVMTSWAFSRPRELISAWMTKEPGANVFVGRSVKYEEVYLNAYESLPEASQSLGKYNQNRKHQIGRGSLKNGKYLLNHLSKNWGSLQLLLNHIYIEKKL